MMEKTGPWISEGLWRSLGGEVMPPLTDDERCLVFTLTKEESGKKSFTGICVHMLLRSVTSFHDSHVISVKPPKHREELKRKARIFVNLFFSSLYVILGTRSWFTYL